MKGAYDTMYTLSLAAAAETAVHLCKLRINIRGLGIDVTMYANLCKDTVHEVA